MLINHNNGTGSRVRDCSGGPAGKVPEVKDFLTLCLTSYFGSVQSDCPLVVVDDASTDDSAAIIGSHENRITRFIQYDDNRGLTQAMNETAELLISRYNCDVICRFDGDMEFLTLGWDLAFLRYFERHQDAGAVGACQLSPYGAIWALGDMLVHPRGYVHILGCPTWATENPPPPIFLSKDAVLGDVECDSVMGCLAAFRSEAFREVGGLRPEFSQLRGETEDLNLRLWLKGYRSVALGGVQFIHRHMEHQEKESATYDQEDKVKESFYVWPKLWGWHKLKPDLSAIYAKWKGTMIARNLVQAVDGTVRYIGP